MPVDEIEHYNGLLPPSPDVAAADAHGTRPLTGPELLLDAALTVGCSCRPRVVLDPRPFGSHVHHERTCKVFL